MMALAIAFSALGDEPLQVTTDQTYGMVCYHNWRQVDCWPMRAWDGPPGSFN